MKLERLHEYLLPTVVTLLGMGFAVYCGKLSATGQVGMLALIALAMLCTVLTVWLNRRVWMLIPFGWMLTGRILILPIPFTVRDLIVMFAFAAMAVMIALKLVRRKASFGLVELFMWLNLLYIGIAFIRNPIGLDTLQSARVGGRDYFNILIAILAFLALTRATASVSQARRIPILVVIATGLGALISMVTYFVPETVPLIGMFYSGVYTSGYNALDYRVAAVTGAVADRIDTLMFFAESLFLALCAFYRPITLLIPANFWRFTGLLISIAATLYSGFRSVVLYNGAMFVLSSYYRGKLRETLTLAFVAIPLVGMLLLGQGNIFNLPMVAQRALSFLPAKWKYEAVEQASGSTEWRVEMWKAALTTDKYIEDKIFGDGFGYRRIDLQLMELYAARGPTFMDTQELQMLVGGFHSGPVSTIRYVGVVGMVLFYTFMIALTVRAAQLIKRSRGTPLFPPVLFVCLPLVFHPFFFTVIFGAYQDAVASSIFGLGMLKLLTQSLDSHLSEGVVANDGSREVLGATKERERRRLEPIALALPK